MITTIIIPVLVPEKKVDIRPELFIKNKRITEILYQEYSKIGDPLYITNDHAVGYSISKLNMPCIVMPGEYKTEFMLTRDFCIEYNREDHIFITDFADPLLICHLEKLTKFFKQCREEQVDFGYLLGIKAVYSNGMSMCGYKEDMSDMKKKIVYYTNEIPESIRFDTSSRFREIKQCIINCGILV